MADVPQPRVPQRVGKVSERMTDGDDVAALEQRASLALRTVDELDGRE